MANLKKQFSDIYDKYVEKIYRFVFLKVSSQEIAEDLTSEVFTKSWDKFQQDNCDIKNMQAFLYQVARNLITDHYREKAQARLVSVDKASPIPDVTINLEAQAALTSDTDRIKAALAHVNDDYREVIIWYYLDELSVPEIAKIMNKSEEAVRVTIHRALKTLRAELSVGT